jgi:hypothetical protein
MRTSAQARHPSSDPVPADKQATSFAEAATAAGRSPSTARSTSSATPSNGALQRRFPAGVQHFLGRGNFTDRSCVFESKGEENAMLTKIVIGTLTAATVQVAAAEVSSAEVKEVVWWISPTEVQPGGQLQAGTAAYEGGCVASTPVTSPGLVAPLQWTTGGNYGRQGGYGTAVRRPGKYTATFTCSDGTKTSRTFTVLGTPPATPTPKPTKPRTGQVPIKPVGAPQTGGGGTTSEFFSTH